MSRLLRQHFIHEGDGARLLSEPEQRRRVGEPQRRFCLPAVRLTNGGCEVEAADPQRLRRQQHQICRAQPRERAV